MTKLELQSECRKMRRKVGGTKQDLRTRLEDVFETNCRGCKTRGNAEMAAGRFLDSGSFRNVYLTTYTKGPRKGQQGVYKLFKDKHPGNGAEVVGNLFADDLSTVAEAGRIIEAFNHHNDIVATTAGGESRRRVYLNKPEVWQLDARDILVEPFIQGNYAKFNSNSGWVNDKCEHRLMQALSHFSFHFTGGQRLLCDLQGGAYDTHFVLTDPAILSTGKEFGPADGGSEFMENFFAHHKCSEYCDRSWRCMAHVKKRFPVSMGTSFFGRRPLGHTTALNAIQNKAFHR